MTTTYKLRTLAPAQIKMAYEKITGREMAESVPSIIEEQVNAGIHAFPYCGPTETTFGGMLVVDHTQGCFATLAIQRDWFSTHTVFHVDGIHGNHLVDIKRTLGRSF